MKKSSKVSLILIGTATLLAGCGPNIDSASSAQKVSQHSYMSRDDCRRDWGDDDRDCRPSARGGGFVGPMHYWNHSTGTPYAVDSDGSHRALPRAAISSSQASKSASSVAHSSVSRGGFGSTGHGHSSGG